MAAAYPTILLLIAPLSTIYGPTTWTPKFNNYAYFFDVSNSLSGTPLGLQRLYLAYNQYRVCLASGSPFFVFLFSFDGFQSRRLWFSSVTVLVLGMVFCCFFFFSFSLVFFVSSLLFFVFFLPFSLFLHQVSSFLSRFHWFFLLFIFSTVFFVFFLVFNDFFLWFPFFVSFVGFH